jgi:NADH-quinone oxidoreductase subunit N
MVTAVVAAFIYLRIILTMYAPAEGEEAPDGPRIRVDAGTGIALTIAATAILVLGVVPGPMLDFARDATQLLVR